MKDSARKVQGRSAISFSTGLRQIIYLYYRRIWMLSTIAIVVTYPTHCKSEKFICAPCGKMPFRSPTFFLLEAGIQRAYRATPKRVWMNGLENDENGRFVRDICVEIPVACLTGLVTW